jgi:hypothetical protein
VACDNLFKGIGCLTNRLNLQFWFRIVLQVAEAAGAAAAGAGGAARVAKVASRSTKKRSRTCRFVTVLSCHICRWAVSKYQRLLGFG